MPLLVVAAAFSAGIVCARQWHPPLALSTDLVSSFAIAMIALRRRRWIAWFSVCVLWMGLGCWCAQLQTPVDQQAALRSSADGLSRTVRGQVLATHMLPPSQVLQGSPSSPVDPWTIEPGGWETEQGEARQSIDLRLESIEEVTPDRSTMRTVQGGLRLTTFGKTLPVHCGDIVEVPVRLRLPERYRDPGAFSYADWLLEQNIGALGSADSAHVHIVHSGTSSFHCRMLDLQQKATTHLEHAAHLQLPGSSRLLPHLTADETAILAAMLFGDRSHLSQAQRAGFERTGTFHLLVVSGFHITLITFAIYWMLRKSRCPELIAVAITILSSLFYALLTGFGVPVERALLMCSLYLIVKVLDRERSGFNALGFAALLILVPQPRALFEASFQMTALVILAVAGIAIPLQTRLFGGWRSILYELDVTDLDIHLHPQLAQARVTLRMWSQLLKRLLGLRSVHRIPALVFRLGLVVLESCLLSCCIELCMALPMAYYFHRLTATALFANLLIAPLSSTMAGCAALTFLCSFVSSWIALPPMLLTKALLHLTTAIVSVLANTQLGDLRTPAPPTGSLVTCLVLLAFVIWALRERQRFLFLAGTFCAVLIPVLGLWPTHPNLRQNHLEVTALDVGQGDSLLVVSPQGETMLVDAGGPVGRLVSKWDVGEQVVAPYLWSRHIRRLDVVVITHGHSDHIGGMPAILQDLRPRELWLSLQPGNSAPVRNLLQQAKLLGIQVRWLAAGDSLEWGSVHTTVLAPERSYANWGDARNDDSLVLRMDWHRASVLLEGDAESPSEQAMLDHGRLRPVVLLKVGHHGSRTSSTPDFLSAVRPREAVISVGQQNTFGHPRWEVLERLEKLRTPTFRTDRTGAATFLLAADGTISEESASK